MKKQLLFILLILISAPILVNAQSKFSLQVNGAAGGFKDNFFYRNSSSQKYSEPGISFKSDVVVYYNLFRGLNIGSGIGYESLNSKTKVGNQFIVADPSIVVTSQSYNNKINYSFITVPIRLKYNVLLKTKFYLPIETGISYQYLYSAQLEKRVDVDVKQSMYSFNGAFGLGYLLNTNLGFELKANYNHLLTNLDEGFYSNSNSTFINAPLKGKNTIWGGVSVSYQF